MKYVFFASYNNNKTLLLCELQKFCYFTIKIIYLKLMNKFLLCQKLFNIVFLLSWNKCNETYTKKWKTNKNESVVSYEIYIKCTLHTFLTLCYFIHNNSFVSTKKQFNIDCVSSSKRLYVINVIVSLFQNTV